MPFELLYGGRIGCVCSTAHTGAMQITQKKGHEILSQSLRGKNRTTAQNKQSTNSRLI